MPDIHISLRMTGIIALLAVIILSGTWAIVTMATSGAIDSDTALRSLLLLYSVILIAGGFVYLDT